MPKLHEVIALTTGKKGAVEAAITVIYHLVQKTELFSGLTKTYQPNDDDGERQPPETTRPQQSVKALILSAVGLWVDLFDVVFTNDRGNQLAKADIVVDGVVLARDVPVPSLLFLEKQLDHWLTFAGKLPTPDPAFAWADDPNSGWLAAPPVQTSRTKKMQKPIVLYDATPQHPAQTQLITEDVNVGYWTTTRFSTAIPADDRAAFVVRATKLRDAVKVAREQANAVEVERMEMGAALAGYVFGRYANK